MIDALNYNTEKLKDLKSEILIKLNEKSVLESDRSGSEKTNTDKMSKLIEELDELSLRRKQ